MFNIIAISDTHGYLPKIEKEFDLLLVGGDVAPNKGYGGYFECEYQREWFQNEFVPWVMNLPFKDKASKVVFIAGNHDFYLESESEAYKVGYSSIWTDIIHPCYNRLTYLYDQILQFNKETDGKIEWLKIYGTPWCKKFGSWAFMVNNEKLKTAFDQIPNDLDILLTHDAPKLPPHGFITEGNYAGEDAGNAPLADAVKEKKPKFHFYGHIHSSSHEMNVPEGCETKVVCVSINNETYAPTYKPFEIQIEGHFEEKTA